MGPKKPSKVQPGAIPDCSLPSCSFGKCRANSRKNPNCFCQLGEKFWYSEIRESHWTSLKDPESERKDEFGYVGFKNLGATCYVNTYLQLWFSNKVFRSAIYQWKPVGHDEMTQVIIDSDDNFKRISLDFGENSTNKICGNLLYLFSLLQYSQRKFVDPSAFVDSLGLQTNEQQDAQEFSKLFISLLHETLASQNESLSKILDRQFGGSYLYQTKCNICASISLTASKFYELDLNIKGHYKLTECLKEFLKPELMEGDNRYHCSKCQKKQDATRRIVLEKLPPVLNIQLLRFVYDRQSAAKKKLNTSILFPDTIDMNNYMLFDNKEDGIYHLCAVLLHCGFSAHSGHYVAHILDKEKGVWCKYNDESVSVMKGTTLLLGKEDELEDIYEAKQKKLKKSCEGHTSKNAYMLVYRRAVAETTTCEVPYDMMEVVAADNSLFEEWVSHHKAIRNQAIEKGRERQMMIQNIYPMLPVKEGGDFEWLSSSWLKQWLSCNSHLTQPIDNSDFECIHSLLDPSKLHLMKRVSSQAVELLASHYSAHRRLPADSVCVTCRDCNARREEFEEKLEEDMKNMNKLLKEVNKDLQNCFWVGKKSLKGFKQLARRRIHDSSQIKHLSSENSIEEIASVSQESKIVSSTADVTNEVASIDPEFAMTCDSEGTKNLINDSEMMCGSLRINNSADCYIDSDKKSYSKDRSGDAINLAESDSKEKHSKVGKQCKRKCEPSTEQCEKILTFQEDIICLDHKKLCLNDNARKLVSPEVWNMCKVYFPDAEAFPYGIEVCALCARQQQNSLEEKETMKFLIKEQKQVLHFLQEDPMQRMATILAESQVTLHVILSSFVALWKRLTRHSGNLARLTADNSEIICEHDLLLYNAEEIIDESVGNDPEIFLVSEKEYALFTQFYPIVGDVVLKRNSVKCEESDITKYEYELMPDFCASCRRDRLVSDAEDARTYIAAPIYITRRFKKGGVIGVDSGNESSDVLCPDDRSNIALKLKEKSNLNYHVKETSLMNFSGETRRSSRKRVKRGEYVVHVNSYETLKDLKVKLLTIFSVLPIEQTLAFEGGCVIDGNDRNLADLGILPNCHLILTVDEPNKELLLSEKLSDKPRALESGFKGTNLLYSSAP